MYDNGIPNLARKGGSFQAIQKLLQNLFECEYTTTVIHWFDIHVAPFATK